MQGDREINALFSGIKGALTPQGGGGSLLRALLTFQPMCVMLFLCVCSK